MISELILPQSSVVPSGSALATSFDPMPPEAPPRFSTTTGWRFFVPPATILPVVTVTDPGHVRKEACWRALIPQPLEASLPYIGRQSIGFSSISLSHLHEQYFFGPLPD